MNKIILFSIFYFLFFVFLATPVALGVGILGPLVPCGNEYDSEGHITNPCGWCHLFELAKNIIDWLMIIAIPITVAMAVYGGIMIMISAGSPEKAKSGREIIKAAVVGLLVVLLAWLILDTIFKVVTPEEGEYFKQKFGPWNELKCRPPD